MPICECGLNFAQAILDGREVESYAVIRDEDYQKVIAYESQTRSESDEEVISERIAEASIWVGTLQVCPECGTLSLSKPMRYDDTEENRMMRKSVRLWLRDNNATCE
jgi:hypothetical protein